MSLDHFHGRTYSPEYRCKEFAADLWEHLTGQNILPLLEARHGNKHRFSEIKKPSREQSCLAFMRNELTGEPHVGVLYKGRIMHLQPSGSEYVLPAILIARGFSDGIRYFTCLKK